MPKFYLVLLDIIIIDRLDSLVATVSDWRLIIVKDLGTKVTHNMFRRLQQMISINLLINVLKLITVCLTAEMSYPDWYELKVDEKLF